MIYHPDRGAMWDPSILWHDGRYYAFMMYNRDGVNGGEARHCLLAVSEDGVHWHDEAVVIEEREGIETASSASAWLPAAASDSS